jgi:WD40 repeat protein
MPVTHDDWPCRQRVGQQRHLSPLHLRGLSGNPQYVFLLIMKRPYLMQGLGSRFRSQTQGYGHHSQSKQCSTSPCFGSRPYAYPVHVALQLGFVGTSSGLLLALDLTSGNCIRVMAGHQHSITFLELVGASTTISASTDGTVIKWDLMTVGVDDVSSYNILQCCYRVMNIPLSSMLE